MIKYSIFPTLLDSFYWYKRMGTAEKFQEIIDKINRVKSPMPPDAAKGVAFESVVNAILKAGVNKHPIIQGAETFTAGDFTFNSALLLRIARKLENAAKQQEYIQAVVQTPVGDIKVYGFIDFSYPDMHVDLKTTGSYSRGKYAINNQHRCYPLLSQINGGRVDKFNYLVTDFQDMYIEPYAYTQTMKDEFIFNLVEFTEFLEMHRDKITDGKIFGL